MKKILIILLLIVLTILPTFASNWVKIDDKCYADTELVSPYVDDFGRKNQHKYVLWLKQLNDGSAYFKNLEIHYKKKVPYTMYKYIIDTQKNSIALKSCYPYDINHKQSIKYDNQLDFMLKWEPIIPGTTGAHMLLIVKKYR